MSNQTLEQVNDSLVSMITRGEGVTIEEALKALESVSDKELVAANADYLSIKPNTVLNLVFTGMDTAMLDGKEVEIVKLRDAEKEYIAAQAVLVSTCKKLRSQPCLIRVIVRNKLKSAKGEYFDISVLTFPGAL